MRCPKIHRSFLVSAVLSVSRPPLYRRQSKTRTVVWANASLKQLYWLVRSNVPTVWKCLPRHLVVRKLQMWLLDRRVNFLRTRAARLSKKTEWCAYASQNPYRVEDRLRRMPWLFSLVLVRKFLQFQNDLEPTIRSIPSSSGMANLLQATGETIRMSLSRTFSEITCRFANASS